MSDFPYHGLRPFNRDETDIFFGREQHTDELIARLSKQNFLAVVGYSGCGKSSLIRTGLIPSLQAGFLAGAGTHWQVAEFRPSNQPFENLALALADDEALGDSYRTALVDNQILKRGSLSLHELLAIKPLSNKGKLLIVCDQFEEIFRYYDEGEKTEAEAFIKLLLASCLPYRLPDGVESRDVYVVLTMRSDFLGDCAVFSGLAEAINEGLYLTPRLTREQLREAIEEPAFVFNGEVAPDLVVQLLEDAEHNPDQLPLLQHALMIMWLLVEKAQGKGKKILLTLDSYKALGTLKNILSAHADDIFEKDLSSEQQRLAEVMFKALSERGSDQRDTRRPQKLSALVALMQVDIDEVITIIEVFRHQWRSFLVPSDDVELNSESVIDISHESFIRQWHTLQQWTEDEAESGKKFSRLRERALLRKQGKVGGLIEPELSVYWEWYKQKQPTKLWAKRYLGEFEITEKYLLKSRRRYFWRRFITVSSGILIITGSAIGYQHQREQTKKIELVNKNLQQAKDNVEQAKNNIEQEKNKTKQSLNMLYKVRNVFFTKENSPKLEKIFAELVKEDPKNVDAWIYYGDALKNQDKFVEVENAYRQAINLHSASIILKLGIL